MSRQNTTISDLKDGLLQTANTDAPHLVVIFGNDKGKSFPLESGEYVLGRSPDMDIFLNDPLISRKHCSLSVSGNKIKVADLNSRNGTFVNGNKIKSKALRDNSYLQVGKSILKIHYFDEFTIAAVFDDGKKSYKVKNKDSQRIRKIIEYINNNISEKLSLNTAAAKFDLDPVYFSAYFKKQTGENFVEYLNTKRIMLACEKLMKTADQIIEISYSTGFHNLSLFNRTFKKITGFTPKKYRLEYKKG